MGFEELFKIRDSHPGNYREERYPAHTKHSNLIPDNSKQTVNYIF
jgi:hypothetical protein